MYSCRESGQYLKTSSITYIKLFRTCVWYGLLNVVDVSCDMLRDAAVRVTICVQWVLVLSNCGVCLWMYIVVVVRWLRGPLLILMLRLWWWLKVSIKSFSTVKAFMTGFVVEMTFWDIPIAIVSTSSLLSYSFPNFWDDWERLAEGGNSLVVLSSICFGMCRS